MFGILVLAMFLRIYRLNELLAFGGDVARDFLAARDMTFKGQIPLVGSPTSVPWLYQGAFFTYILGIILWLGKYNPLSGGYFVGVMGVLGVLGIYFLGKKLFSEKVGLISSFFYATSPLIVLFDRYPYHQSLISIFTIFFIFSLWMIEKDRKYVPLAFFIFGLLMQLELSNLALLPILLIWIFLYRRKINFKLLTLSVFAFLSTWLPKIIFDFNNGFTQTFGFVAWIVHKLPLVSSLIGEQEIKMNLGERFFAIMGYLSRIIVWPSVGVSIVIFIFLVFLLLKKNLKEFRGAIKEGLNQKGNLLLLIWVLIPCLAFFIQGSPSESYVPVLFGAISLLVGVGVSLVRCPAKSAGRRLARLVAATGVVAIGVFNIYLLLSNDFFIKTERNSFVDGNYNLGQSLAINQDMAKFIVRDAAGRKFNLIALGNFGKFSSSIDSLYYLTWYFGNEPSKDRESIQYFIFNKEDNIKVRGAEVTQEFPYQVIARKARK